MIKNLPTVIDSSPHSPKVAQGWHPPVGNCLKLNFDGSSLGNPGPSRKGGIIFDASRSCKVAYSGPLGYGDSLYAEIKALLYGLRLIKPRVIGSHNIEVEGDSEVVIGWMTNGNTGSWSLSYIIKEATFLVSTMNISFKWIPWETNEGIDRLAKRGVEKASTFVGSLEEEML